MKKRIAIICGGPSSEHEISCISAAGILSAIDRELFEPILIGITKSGKWVLLPIDHKFEITEKQLPSVPENLTEIDKTLAGLNIDIAFPVLHGPYGEDGQIQKHFEDNGISYVGNGVEASAIAMDKSESKKLFASHGLSIAPGVTINRGELIKDPNLGFPLFVKPARGGSSRGTHKVNSIDELSSAIEDALNYDEKVLIEQAIAGREIEVAVLESDGKLIASTPGEIKIDPKFEFYDFEAKYLDGATSVSIPAELNQDAINKIKELAITAFKSLGCNGLARVDFFYTPKNEFIINELNTLPGFTPTSVYPKLMAASGFDYKKIITELIKSCQ